MDVEKSAHHETTGYDEGYDWTEYSFDIDGREYRVEHRFGTGVTVIAPPEQREDDLAAVADYLMRQDGIRHVYLNRSERLERLRPERLREPRPLRTNERNLLDHLLAVDDRRVFPLRDQARYVVVEDDAGVPFRLELQVPEQDAPPARELQDQHTITAHSIREDEDGLEVSLWLDGGYLDTIEVSWYVNEPCRLPRPDELHPAQLG